MDEIAMMLAGRVAEEIVIEDITTGASNDIQRASAIARKMVTEWGMSPLGTIYLGNPEHEVFWDAISISRQCRPKPPRKSTPK